MIRRIVLWSVLIALPLPLIAAAIGGVLLLRQGGLAPYRVPSAGGDIVAAGDASEGAYLARIGNCLTCHTVRGGVAFAGGRPFRTDYGTLYSTNLTPDSKTGLGDWSAEEFRHAMRHGVSRHGVLYPAFPYANFAHLTDADLDALFAYLRTLAPVEATPPPNDLAWPANWRGALVGWRMLHYRPAPLPERAGASPDWLRGRYLVDGLGHCAMCHGTRGAQGSLPAEGYLAGGRIPGQGWYAPPLDARQLARYDVDQLAGYLSTGNGEHGAAYGSMAEVVYTSLRHLRPEDARAMATYLKSVPAHGGDEKPDSGRFLYAAAQPAANPHNGGRLYQDHCASCHGDGGEGRGRDYPPLRGAVSVTAPDPVNAVRLVLYGGVPPTTAGNPRPHSMPPFAGRLSNAEIAAIVSHIRRNWGEQDRPVSAADVAAYYGIRGD